MLLNVKRYRKVLYPKRHLNLDYFEEIADCDTYLVQIINGNDNIEEKGMDDGLTYW